LSGARWVTKKNIRDNSKVPRRRRLLKLIRERRRIATEGPEFKMLSHYMKEVASVKTKRQSQPVKTKKLTKPEKKPVPKMVRKWVPKIATPAKSVDPK
jgi:hypothetical protein